MLLLLRAIGLQVTLGKEGLGEGKWLNNMIVCVNALLRVTMPNV